MTKVTNSPITKTFHNIAIRATVDGDAAGVKLLESKDFPTGGTWHGSWRVQSGNTKGEEFWNEIRGRDPWKFVSVYEFKATFFPAAHWHQSDVVQVISYLLTQSPKYKYSRQYFSNQLVSTYRDKFQCVANLLEDGTVKWVPSTLYELVYDEEKMKFGTILRLEELEPFRTWKVMVAGEPWSYLKTIFLSSDPTQKLDILDTGWKGTNATQRYGWEQLDNLKNHLPNAPQYLAQVFGGWSAVETEQEYNNQGKVIGTYKRCFQVINNQQEIPLVKDCGLTDIPSPLSFTVRKVS